MTVFLPKWWELPTEKSERVRIRDKRIEQVIFDSFFMGANAETLLPKG
jgi:hypothetical protein